MFATTNNKQYLHSIYFNSFTSSPGANDFFVWSGQQQIAMGGGGEGFGFVLDSDFATGESFRSATYGNQILVEREHGSFRIANVECWGFEGIFGVTSKSSNNRKSHS